MVDTMTTPLAFLPKVRSDHIMASAAGQPCSLRLPLVCNRANTTTVCAHLPGIGKGTGTKVSDLHVAYACSACHDVIDGRTPQPDHLGDAMILEAMLRGLCETQARLVEAEIFVVPKSTTI